MPLCSAQAPANVAAVTKTKQGRTAGARSKGAAAASTAGAEVVDDAGAAEAQGAVAGPQVAGGGSGLPHAPRGALSWWWPWTGRQSSDQHTQPKAFVRQARLCGAAPVQGASPSIPALASSSGMLGRGVPGYYGVAQPGLSCLHQWVRTLALLIFATAALLIGLGVLALGSSALLLVQHLLFMLQKQQQDGTGDGDVLLYSAVRSLLKTMLQQAEIAIPVEH